MSKLLKTCIIEVKAWLLAVASNLWEDYLKDELRDQIHSLIVRGVNLAQAYHNTEDYQMKKDSVLNFVFKNIQLPVILKPFKGLIRSILSNNIEKQIDKAFTAINNAIEK